MDTFQNSEKLLSQTYDVTLNFKLYINILFCFLSKHSEYLNTQNIQIKNFLQFYKCLEASPVLISGYLISKLPV